MLNEMDRFKNDDSSESEYETDDEVVPPGTIPCSIMCVSCAWERICLTTLVHSLGPPARISSTAQTTTADPVEQSTTANLTVQSTTANSTAAVPADAPKKKKRKKKNKNKNDTLPDLEVYLNNAEPPEAEDPFDMYVAFRWFLLGQHTRRSS